MFYSFARWIWPYFKYLSPLVAIGFVLLWSITGDGEYAKMAAIQIAVSIAIMYISPIFEKDETS